MAKGLKEVEKIADNLNNSIKWSASMYKYLQDALLLLKQLQLLKDFSKVEGLYKQIRYALRYATNSERRGVNRYYPRVKNGLKDIEEYLGDDFRKELDEIRELLRPNEAVLTKETSFYIGKLKDNFEDLGPQLQLLKKNKGNPTVVQSLITELMKEINHTVAKEAGQVGLVPFIAILEKRLKPLVTRLKNISA